MDPDAYRARSRERWERAAGGWAARRAEVREATRPVTERLLDLLRLEPGQTVLELTAGPGDTGLLAAERIGPEGRLIATDGAEPMVELIRARAAELGLTNVEARPMEAEWIDLPAATVDRVLSRWGYMLLVDPGAALAETRRVLRPGGRVALAAWTSAQENPWSSVVGMELVGRGIVEPPDPDEPGQFAWADQAVIAEHLESAGFTGVEVDVVRFTQHYPDREAWWDTMIDCSPMLADTLRELDPAARDEVEEAAAARLEDYVQDDGSLAVPAATNVAAADA